MSNYYLDRKERKKNKLKPKKKKTDLTLEA